MLRPTSRLEDHGLRFTLDLLDRYGRPRSLAARHGAALGVICLAIRVPGAGAGELSYSSIPSRLLGLREGCGPLVPGPGGLSPGGAAAVASVALVG